MSDPELSKIGDIVADPFKLTNKALIDINYNYHAALQKSLIVLEDDMLIYHEPLAGTEPIHASSLFLGNSATYYSLPSTQTRLAATSIHTACCIVSVFGTIGQACFCM